MGHKVLNFIPVQAGSGIICGTERGLDKSGKRITCTQFAEYIVEGVPRCSSCFRKIKAEFEQK